MMNSTNTPRRDTKRAIGLGLAALSMSLVGTVSRADNTAAATAKHLPVNTGFLDCVATMGDSKFYYASLYANRSYVWETTVIGYEMNAALPIMVFHTVSTSASMTPSLTVTLTQYGVEGSTNSDTWTLNRTARFSPTANGTHYLRATEASNGTGCVYVSLRETTLFSPWLSKAAGYEGFIELHNNTKDPVNVTLKGYDNTGTLQGTGLTFAIPGNATVFQTGATIGVPAGAAAGVVLTHDAAFGAISGNITTLNGATGLSFDSPFTPRSDYVRLH